MSNRERACHAMRIPRSPYNSNRTVIHAAPNEKGKKLKGPALMVVQPKLAAYIQAVNRSNVPMSTRIVVSVATATPAPSQMAIVTVMARVAVGADNEVQVPAAAMKNPVTNKLMIQ